MNPDTTECLRPVSSVLYNMFMWLREVNEQRDKSKFSNNYIEIVLSKGEKKQNLNRNRFRLFQKSVNLRSTTIRNKARKTAKKENTKN